MVSLACWRTLSFVVASRTMVAGRSWESSNGAVHRARCSDDADAHDISAAAGLRCAACMPVSFRKALAASEALLMQGSGRFRPQWHRAHWYHYIAQPAGPDRKPSLAARNGVRAGHHRTRCRPPAATKGRGTSACSPANTGPAAMGSSGGGGAAPPAAPASSRPEQQR